MNVVVINRLLLEEVYAQYMESEAEPKRKRRVGTKGKSTEQGGTKKIDRRFKKSRISC